MREQLPAIIHWGADLGELTVADARSMALAGVHPIIANIVDEPVRLSLLPEHHTGWVGRPGLSGSRQGRDWSPKFTTTGLRVDAVAVEPGEAPSLLPGSVLISTGLTDAPVNPDHTVLYLVDAVD